MPYSRPTALSMSASSGKAKPPLSAAKASWASTDWGLMASTWAPVSANAPMSSV